MPVVNLPISSPTYKGVDEIELVDEGFLLMDGYMDEKGSSVKRPGLSLFKNASVGMYAIDGLYWNVPRSNLFASCFGQLLLIIKDPVTGAFAITSFGLLLQGGAPRTIFTTDGVLTFAANGGRIVQTSGSVAQVLADADAPQAVSHVAWIDGYILANSVGTNKFYFSDVNNSTSWNALNFASAAGNADPITAIHVRNREIYLFGQSTIEIWQNDGQTPFSRIDGGYLETGCAAPYSIVLSKSGIYWLDNERQFVKWDGRNMPQRIGSPYDREIERFSMVSDCLGDRVNESGNELIIWSFPGANRTLVFNATTETWSEWGRYNQAGSYDRYIGSCFVYAEDWLLNIVGSRLADNLYTLSRNQYSDDGESIRYMTVTGHLTHGTDQVKRNKQLRIRAKRGSGGTLMLRWRDNRSSTWNDLKTYSLGSLGDTNLVIKIHRTGSYRTRQYEMSMSDNVPFVLASAEEEMEILR